MKKKLIEISVVICTYNREKLLQRALESLLQQTFDRSRYEIIIVDNYSTDDAYKLVESFRFKYPKANIVYLFEKEQGLGRARNKGYKRAKGEYVAFLDDDAMVDKNWLNVVLDCFRKITPSPSVVGGPIYPFYGAPKPVWFRDKYETRFWGKEGRFLKKGETFSGSNMIFKKEIFSAYGEFNQDVGMKEKIISVGEETYLFEKIWQSPKNIFCYYSPKLIVYHAVPNYKMTVSYQLKRSFAAGQALARRNRNIVLIYRIIKILTYSFALITFICWAIIQRFRYRVFQNWCVERLSVIAYLLGYVTGSVGVSIDCRQKK